MYGLKDRYDVVLSIGGTCSVTGALRKAGMQYSSMPLDWAGSFRIESNVGALLTGFSDFFVPGMRMLRHDASTPHDVYVNDSNGIVFYHDVPRDVALSEVYGAVAEKYRKRQSRCLSLLAKAKSILFVYVELAKNLSLNSDETLCAVRESLAAAYPDAVVDVPFFHHRDGKDFRESDVVELRPHLFKVACDAVRDGDRDNMLADEWLLAERLRRLVPGGAADYRTSAEKREFATRQRMKKWGRMHATGWYGYLRNRLYYGAYRFFERKLRKLGVVG